MPDVQSIAMKTKASGAKALSVLSPASPAPPRKVAPTGAQDAARELRILSAPESIPDRIYVYAEGSASRFSEVQPAFSIAAVIGVNTRRSSGLPGVRLLRIEDVTSETVVRDSRPPAAPEPMTVPMAALERMAAAQPDALLDLIEGGRLVSSSLTFAAEIAGRLTTNARAVSALLRLLDSAEAVVREGALYGLSRLPLDDRARAAISRVASADANSDVREAAEAALDRDA